MNWQKSLPKRLMPTMITRKFFILGKKQNKGGDDSEMANTIRLLPDRCNNKNILSWRKGSTCNDQEVEANTGPNINIHRTYGNSGVPAQIQTLSEPELRVRRR
ncbi:hypothetical protein EVAR_102478_1 [Eumeta japonica]|uniref:Uncharacterized protein n=1 Tax=Eumeta variegata TaxID=151549 RepID=A0A4C1ZQP2_EUMVA|nr:hypothetical protein EVAR_102478_1 [Eumeta japonica]